MRWDGEWNHLQKEVVEWATRNFGKVEKWQLVAGICEEVGEMIEAVNRPFGSYSQDSVIDAIADQIIYALNLSYQIKSEFWKFDREYLDDTGMLIAIGKVQHALLKHSQGIRKVDIQTLDLELNTFLLKWRAWLDTAWTLHNPLDMTGFLTMTNTIWLTVKERNWKDSPETGKPKQGECYPGHRCNWWPECASCGLPRI